jgi:ribosomal protein S18 acetylase RimI-like enzyme
MFKELKLLRSGEIATLEILGPKDIDYVLTLQEETRAALSEDHKMFVLPQSASYFQNLLEQKNGVMIGIRSRGQLISQMAVMGAMTVEDMIDLQKLTHNDIVLHHAAPSDFAVIAKSMAVHPSFRGNELSQHMLDMALNLPIARRADHMFAQISVGNTLSWDLFLRQGFGIVAAAIDPVDNKPRFVMQKPTLDFAIHHMQTTGGIDPAMDFPAIMRMTQREALIGQLDTTQASKLAFHASADMAAAWHDDATTTAAI